MPVYETSFEIKAPAERVWDILIALDRYCEWNPQIPKASGLIEAGESIDLRLKMPGRPAMDVSATIEEAQPNLLLTWRGHVAATWFFEGYRRFEIKPVDIDRVRLTHTEDIHGALAPIFSLLMGGPTVKSHQALNEALRVRAERSQ